MPHSARPFPRRRRVAIALYTTVAVAIAVGVFVDSYAWINRTFPGFFLMANRVVPSVGLAHWTGLRQQTSIYQRQVVRVDGRPVSSARDVYDIVAAASPGTVFHYDLVAGDVREQRAVASMRFSFGDYISLASDDDFLAAAWTDGRSGVPRIFVRTIELEKREVRSTNIGRS